MGVQSWLFLQPHHNLVLLLVSEDALELSGIVSILFAGITMKYYTAPNLSSQAQQITTSFFQMLSKLSETFVFIYIGLGTFLEQQSWNNVGFTFFTIVSILIARIWNVYPCSALVNRFREQPKHIRKNQQHALWFSGLRGAMAFALARQSVTDLPSGHGHVLLTTTLLTIFFTVLFIGGLTSYALKFLNIVCHGPEHDEEVDDESDEESMEDVASSQKVLKIKVAPRPTTLSKQKEKISEKLKQLKTDTSFTTLDTKYLKPFLQAVPSGEGSDPRGATQIAGQKQHGNQAEHQSKSKLPPKVEEEDVDEDEFSESRGLLMSSKS